MSSGCILTISGVDSPQNADDTICMMQINTDDGATEALPPTGQRKPSLQRGHTFTGRSEPPS